MTIALRTARRPFAAVVELSRDWLLPARTMRRRLWPLAIGAAYVAAIGALADLHTSNIAIGALVVLDAYNPNTRRFLGVFWPFIATGALYESLRYYLVAATAGRI